VLVSTTREPVPFSLAQALMAGRAVIATSADTLGNLAGDRQDGLLVPGGDADALAMRLAQLRDDPVLRAELGAKAQARAAQRLDLGQAAAALAALVAEALAGAHEPLLHIERGR
jgi:glycosyltransferase involved in cell wall biosynthesis